MQGFPIEIGHDLDPFPALAAHRGGGGLQLLGGQPVDQFAVGQPSGIVGVEQIAQHRAACRLVGGDADKAGQLAVGGDVLFGQRIADRVGRCRA